MITLIACLPLLASQLMHSHNDYAQKRPFDTAWENGFDSMEVDVFPVDGKLLVGHNEKDLKPELTIQSMYLDRLAKIQRERSRRSMGGKYRRMWLLIDVKRDAKVAYELLNKVMSSYPELLNNADIRFVISGDRDIMSIIRDKGRFGGLDGRFPDLGKKYSFDQMPWVSADWSDYFKWNGVGPFPAEEAKKMKTLVDSVHKEHRLIRFWGSPDSAAAWDAQTKARVDLINTDHLAELAKWRTKNR